MLFLVYTTSINIMYWIYIKIRGLFFRIQAKSISGFSRRYFPKRVSHAKSGIQFLAPDFFREKVCNRLHSIYGDCSKCGVFKISKIWLFFCVRKFHTEFSFLTKPHTHLL